MEPSDQRLCIDRCFRRQYGLPGPCHCPKPSTARLALVDPPKQAMKKR